MKMYIANTTRQAQDFTYRLPENNSIRRQRIEIGSQVQLSGDLNQEAVNAVISQHAPYGMIEVSEIDRTRPFIGLCYSIDKEIPVKLIMRGLEHNRGVLIERGIQLRKEAAVATNQTLTENGDVKALEMSVVEQPLKEGAKDIEVDETIRVEDEGSSERPQRWGKNRRGRG